MNIISHQMGEITVVNIIGLLDTSTSADTNAFLMEEINQKRVRLVINLAEVEYITSAGVRCIINAMKLARLGRGDVRLAGVRLEAHGALEMGGLTDVMKMYGTVEEAVGSFG
jgi:anti-anti-sigma factor